jgi:hypothetical protein
VTGTSTTFSTISIGIADVAAGARRSDRTGAGPLTGGGVEDMAGGGIFATADGGGSGGSETSMTVRTFSPCGVLPVRMIFQSGVGTVGPPQESKLG